MRYHYVITVQQRPRFRRSNYITTLSGHFHDAADSGEKQRYDRILAEATAQFGTPATTLFYRCAADPEEAP